MSKKVYDLAVKLGEKNWLNVGAVLEKDDGGRFIILERSFNPAGVPNPDNKSSLIISMFEPKQKTATKLHRLTAIYHFKRGDACSRRKTQI